MEPVEGARYTIEQLIALRESPLVRKPDDLPSIDQWIECSQQSQQESQTQQRKPRTQSQKPDDPSPMGNFSSQRPSLLQTRHTSRSSVQADDIVLGPPKTSFASSRNLSKLEDRDEEESASTNPRSRFFRERDNQKNNKDWHSARNNRQQDDEEPPASDSKFPARRGDRDRDRGDREHGNSNGNGNGFGQRLDQRWSRDARDGEREQRPSQRGGWREREKQRSERPDNQEKDPEWMDEPIVEKENKNQMRTQQDFERWKERMKAGNAPSAEPTEEALPDDIATPIKTSTPATSKPQTPLVTEGGFDKLFGSWAETKRLESPVDARPAKVPLTAAKAKSSRFASMFAPKDEICAAPEEASSPVPMTHAANGLSEDKEGFARIMAMLGNTSRPESSPANDRDFNRPPYSPSPQDALAAMFAKKSAATQSPHPQSGFGGDPFMPPPPPQLQQHEMLQRQQSFPIHMASHPASNIASPDPVSMRQESGASQLPQQMHNIFLDQPPRSVQTPESSNFQNIISSQQPRKTNSLNKDSEFLLNLIQAKNATRPPPQSRPQNEPDNFQLFLDQPPKTQTAAPKPQAPRPSESIEEQLFRQGPPSYQQQQQNIDHRQRVPPGFYEDPSIVVQQAQRSYPNEPPQPGRRQSNVPHIPNGGPGILNTLPGAPQDFPPNFPYMVGPPPNVGDRGMPLPPPGFNPNIRHPPGFAMPGVFPPPGAQGLPPLQQGLQQGMPGPPPGIGMQGPPPPGFFVPNHGPVVPPGFGPPMMMMMGGIRSPEGTSLRSPQEGPQGGMPVLQGMGAFGRR